MKRALTIVLFAAAVFVAGYLAGYFHAQSGFEVPADWRRERIVVYGQLRDEKEHRRELESALRGARRLLSTRSTATSTTHTRP